MSGLRNHFSRIHWVVIILILEEHSRHGLPPMPGGGDSVGGGVWDTDYRRGQFMPEAAEGKGAV